ncbi:uncharacterized protein LOC131695805 [Topomyia yanbarensis]|uniref:uncharacterized protein LOC131687969 n=1 Tax=Topomyia yanbarensis TaxID=2498891 RepID=UPI00273AE6A0|nr:uncharacterized protein LOC131687969 [Topomyia yanbarensis]XP_058840321.1 uncharacterized protein LOC131695805 [Topomyia yanbarensis]
MEINPLHLSEEELNYELALRKIKGPAQSTRRDKCSRLQQAMEQDMRTGCFHTDSSHVMEDSRNIEACQSRVKLLLTPIDTAIKKHDIGFLENVKSRLRHYRNRLIRVHPPPIELRQEYESLQALIAALLEEVYVALNPSIVSPVRERSENTTVHSDRVDQRSNSSDHRSEVSIPNVFPESTRTAPATGTVPKNSSTQTTRFEQQAGPTRIQNGLPIASSTTGKGRGRGVPTRWNLTVPRYQRNEDDSNEWGPNPYSDISHGLPPPAYRSVDSPRDGGGSNNSTEYNRLRDELLNHLLRRERNQQDGPRNPKAIHNWPFKFRGEKDTTSLNTFLDRVECFARSEGVEEEILLRSIKHLLLEDALDWYGRAFAQGSLLSWRHFKEEIRREFLPGSYAQILRIEANFRFQGTNESFAKFYRDISALFRFVSPPMAEDEKFFIVKKNMNAEYAAIVAAARPGTLLELAEVCNGFDETRLLLNRQRRVPFPHNTLLEPNFATPVTSQRTYSGTVTPQRFGRVHAIGLHEAQEVQSHSDLIDFARSEQEDQEWAQQLENLCQQVNALKGRFERREQRRPSNSQGFQYHQSTQERHGTPNTVSNIPQSLSPNQPRSQQQPQQTPIHIQEPHGELRRSTLSCWNCDEDGHRFMDCPKPQAVLFCYRCGRKGFSLRNCPICSTGQGNVQARSQ